MPARRKKAAIKAAESRAAAKKAAIAQGMGLRTWQVRVAAKAAQRMKERLRRQMEGRIKSRKYGLSTIIERLTEGYHLQVRELLLKYGNDKETYMKKAGLLDKKFKKDRESVELQYKNEVDKIYRAFSRKIEDVDRILGKRLGIMLGRIPEKKGAAVKPSAKGTVRAAVKKTEKAPRKHPRRAPAKRQAAKRPAPKKRKR